MIDMKNLAIIPARSGSKGLKDKNVKLLNGVPLIGYSIDVAMSTGIFEEVMVSTDSEQYADIAKKCGANVPFLRSERNSTDAASSWDVVREIIENYRKQGREFDTVCLLQPTSPLRISQDIIGAYDLFEKKSATTIISVCESDHSPLWQNILDESLSMDNFIKTDKSSRQMLDTYYRINGAVYIVNVEHIMKNTNIYENSYAYIMPRERSIDIDEELDFIIAEALIQRRRNA